MSINALTNVAMARRPDFQPANALPQGYRGLAEAANTVPQPVPTDGAPADEGSKEQSKQTNTALQTLSTYIPTEVLTLYVSAVAALGSKSGPGGHEIGRWIPFLCFVVITPTIVWLAFATKLKTAGKSVPTSPATWPVWEMFAATLAYVAWAFALPDTPFAQFENWYSTGLAGFLVLIVSWGLGAVAPLVQRPLAS